MYYILMKTDIFVFLVFLENIQVYIHYNLRAKHAHIITYINKEKCEFIVSVAF